MSTKTLTNKEEENLKGIQTILNLSGLSVHRAGLAGIDAMVLAQEAWEAKGNKFSISDAAELKVKHEARWAKEDGGPVAP